MNRRSFAVGATLAGAGLAGIALQPVAAEPPVTRGTLAAAIPRTIGPYREAGNDGILLPPETPLTRRAYSDLLMRRYVHQGHEVMLLAAAGAATGPGLTVHRPDRCYPAAGFTIASSGEAPLGAPAPHDARASLVTAVRDERRELVHYWVRVGDHYPFTGTDQRLALLMDNLRLRLPAARLVRLSALSAGPDEDADGFARIEAFSHALLQGLDVRGRKLLLGR